MYSRFSEVELRIPSGKYLLFIFLYSSAILLFAKEYEPRREDITIIREKKVNLQVRKWLKKARFCEKTRDYVKVNQNFRIFLQKGIDKLKM